MSFLTEAGQDVQKVTDKATDNPLGSALDALADGLKGSSGKGPDGNAKFMDGGPIDADDASRSFAGKPFIPGAGGLPVTLQVADPLQFLHLANAHDAVAASFAGKTTAQGVVFRDALVREAVLIFSFARGAQNVLQKNKASKGNVGAMLDMAGSLLGGAKAPPPGPEAYEPIFTQVRDALVPVNVASFDYAAIHKAGLDLGKANDAHNEVCKNAMSPDGGGGMGLPSIPGLDGILKKAGVPDIVAKIPEWLFKVQDAYLAMYRESRIAYEWPLIRLVHDYSLDAIRGHWQPTFPIWHERNPEATEAAQTSDNLSEVEKQLKNAQDMLDAKRVNNAYGATDTDIGSSAFDRLKKVQDGVKDLRTSGEDKAGELMGLMQTADDLQSKMPPEAVAALAKAFALFEGDEKAGKKSVTAIMGEALGPALLGKGGKLPPFMQTVIDKIGGAVLAALDKTYRYVHASGYASEALVLVAVNDAISTRLVGIVMGFLGIEEKPVDTKKKQETAKSVVDDAGAGDFSKALGNAGSLVPSTDEAANKAADLVRIFLKNQGEHLDKITIFVAKDISDELFQAWQDALFKDALTLETFLGRLPMLVATSMRNMIFPIFNLLMDALGVGDKLMGAVWNPIKGGVDKVTDVVTSAKDKKDDVNKAGKDAAAAAGRVDDEIDRKQGDISREASDLSNMNRTVSSFDEADQLQREKSGQATDLANEIGSTPEDISKAAKGQKKMSPEEEAQRKDTRSGPLATGRIAAGEARPVTRTMILTAGREKPPATEDDILKQRTGPSTAPKAPDGPKMPSLSDVGNMF